MKIVHHLVIEVARVAIVSISFLGIVVASAEEYEPTPANPAFESVSRSDVVAALENVRPAPRLLLTDESISIVRDKIEKDPRWKLFFETLKQDSDARLDVPPVEYKLQGKRLLGVSREALKRIFAWSFLYRYTGEEKYAKRTEREALAIANFTDWHPSHFLDVAEMTVACSIGYDACKERFSDENRETIKKAILSKGIDAVRNVRGAWKRNTANWNQVCWCGALFGALAVYGDESPEERDLSVDAICDAVNGVTWAMSSYEPDGNYTEGPGYWGYGTGFNILLFGALKSALGTDFGRSDANGFLKSIAYYENVFGTTGNAFNYPDSGGGKIFEPAAFWYCEKLSDPDVVWNENRALTGAYLLARNKLSNNSEFRPMKALIGSRLAVCALLWGAPLDSGSIERLETKRDRDDVLELETEPRDLGYVGLGNGLCCVALFRTAWRFDAAYLGVKCGRPNAPHGHLDAGSFVYDDLGVRWFVELGPEDYHKIESRGMNLWDSSQKSDRWKLFRYNNFGHSVPSINGNLQLVDGQTRFTDVRVGAPGEESFAIIDLTPVYREDLANATRKTILCPNGDLIVEDYFEAPADRGANIERRFLTPASASLGENGQATLCVDVTNAGGEQKSLTKLFATRADVPVELKIVPCETDNDYDASNPGISILVETSRLEPGQKCVFTTTVSTVK